MTYDLHVHTDLSDCAKRDAFPQKYIALAEARGQSILGFSDHCWAEGVAGASPWYQKQPYSRLAARRKELETFLTEHPTDLRVLIGAEGEYANFLLGLDEDAAAYTDYILIPHDHVHMKGFVIPDGYQAKQVAKFLLDSFELLCKHPQRNLFTALCHPMTPCCHPQEYRNEVYRYLTDAQLEDALHGAKEAGLWIELNVSEFACVPKEELKNDAYLRFFAAAKRVGNLLYWGSDAHSPESYEKLHALAPAVMDAVGLTEDDFAKVETLLLNRPVSQTPQA